MNRFILIILMFFFVAPCFADQYVSGYTKSNGTYVQPYYRSDSNGSVKDNYSYKGNTNPYTGDTGSSYYRNSPSSDYYQTTSSYNTQGQLGGSLYKNND